MCFYLDNRAQYSAELFKWKGGKFQFCFLSGPDETHFFIGNPAFYDISSVYGHDGHQRLSLAYDLAAPSYFKASDDSRRRRENFGLLESMLGYLQLGFVLAKP